MSQKVLRAFAWYTYPDVFGLDDDDAAAADPGHPFASAPGKVAAPEEVVYHRPVNPADSGLYNEKRANAYLVLSKTQHHPRVSPGWESEPASLAETFKTADGKVKMGRIVQRHKRHSGELLEIELKIEEN
jgi:hypothetical protein